MERERIEGWGADRRPEDRPGVPMETEPRPAEGAHWREPERQRSDVLVLKRAGLAELTPVFGTTLPPRGLSGLLRRAAYRIPEHHARHWALLLLADRIDVLEHRVREPGTARWVVLGAAALGAVWLGRRALGRRR
jgi:hypothetical protein